jgi:ketosteroid isomerase-like protein
LRDAVEISSDYEIVPGGEIPAPIEPGGVVLAPGAPAGDATDAVRLFNDSLNSGDLDSMMELVAEDCTFENTYPAPDGARFQGRVSIRKFWLDFFQGSQNPHIAVEELISMGERCVMRWVYTWNGPGGQAGRVRGVDIYRVRGGLILEKLSYVKG